MPWMKNTTHNSGNVDRLSAFFTTALAYPELKPVQG
jgi:hypothetical protein